MSDSPCEVQRSPLLGEHTDEILSKVLGYSGKELAEIKVSGAITATGKITRRSGIIPPHPCPSPARGEGGCKQRGEGVSCGK